MLALALLCSLSLAGAGLEAGREALDASVSWHAWRPGAPPPPTLFGVRAFDPETPEEGARARALALQALGWLGVRPDAPPAGARLAYRVVPDEGFAGLWSASLRQVGAALGAGGTLEAPAEIAGRVRAGRSLHLRLRAGEERMELRLWAGRVRLRAGGEPVEARPEDVRFARRRVRNFHPGVWIALALGPGGRLRHPGEEPGAPGLARLLAALPDGEAMEYVIDVRDGRLVAERAWAKTRAGMGLVTGWLGPFREVGGVRVPWAWTSERQGRRVARGRVLAWTWLPGAGDEGD